MQLNYPVNQAHAMVGMLADSRVKHTESMIAIGRIPVGSALAKVIGSDDKVRVASPQTATVTFAGDLVADNEIDMTVNGEAMATVTFAVNHNDTMDAIVTALEALPTVRRATLTDAVNNRQITIVSVNDPIVVEDAEVTLGAGQVAITVAYVINAREFFGLAQISHTIEDADLPNVAGRASYPENALVNSLTQGALHCLFETPFDPDTDNLFMRYIGNGRGNFRNDNAGGDAIDLSALPLRVRTTVTAPDTIGVIEINLP